MKMTDAYKKEKVIEISGATPSKCMKCGKCSASCPNFDEMDIKPHQFVSYVLDGRIDELMQSQTLYKCLSCMACVERCPRSVKPGKLIDGARQLLIRQKGMNHLLSDNVPGMCEDEEIPQQLLVSAFRRYKR
ncbi:MAG: 4Fe-4S dicluster domain-containing protein [Acutalibacteraceae bacterium]